MRMSLSSMLLMCVYFANCSMVLAIPATLSMILGRRIGEHVAGAETRLYSAYPFSWREAENTEIFEDPFSRDAWDFLSANPEQPFYRFEETQGRRVLRYATADVMRPTCVTCHNTHPNSPRTDWKEGDVRGVLQVDLPLTTAVVAAQNAMHSVIILVVVIGGLSLAGTWFFIGNITRKQAKLDRAMLTDNAPVMITYVDTDQRYQFTNKTFRDWFGKSDHDIEGMTVREVVGEDAYQTIGPKLEKALGGEPLSFNLRAPFRPDEMRDLFAAYTPNFSADGSVRGVIEAITETTRINQLEQYLDSILLNLPVGVAIFEGPEFRYFRINQALADLHGLPIDEHLGKPIAEVLPELSESLLPVMRTLLETGQAVSGREFTTSLLDDPKKLRHLVDYLFPIMGTDGRPKAVGTVVVDITELKELEENLLRSQKMEAIGTLAGGIAHDFNNMIQVVMANAEFLEMETGSNEQLECIQKAAQNAAELTRGLLTFARPHVSAAVNVDLNHALLEMVKVLRRVIGENIELVVLLADDPCFISIDPLHLNQLLMNLALNSRDSMIGGGKLSLKVNTARKDGERYAVVSVVDDGNGMSDEDQERMFDPFFTTKDVGEGTGLGLAVCFGIVKQSGGLIEVESVLGEGTTITMLFPAVEEEVLVALHTLPEQRATTRNETILLVEDDAAVRDIGALALQKAGYTVQQAGNGEEALVLLKDSDKPIDVIITDMVMPRMGGNQLLEHIHADYPSIKVLSTSGYAERAELRSGKRIAVPFLQKPYPTSVLIQKIGEVLDS